MAAEDPDRRPPKLIVPPGVTPPPARRPETWSEMAERKRRGHVSRDRRREVAERLGLALPDDPSEEFDP
jgi:hypothetical protein